MPREAELPFQSEPSAREGDITLRILALDADKGASHDLGRARSLGFDCVLAETTAPLMTESLPVPGEERPGGMKLLVDVELDGFPIEHPLVAAHPDSFQVRRERAEEGPVDPRRPGPARGQARARLRSPDAAAPLVEAIGGRLAELAAAGIDGFRIRRPEAVDPELLGPLIAPARRERPDLLLIAQTPGLAWEQARRLEGFDYFVSSLGFWDARAPWLAEEYEALRGTAPLLAEIGGDAAQRATSPTELERLLMLAAGTGSGFILPAALLDRAERMLKAAAELSDAADPFDGEMRLFTAANRITVIVRADHADLRHAGEAMLLLVNRSPEPALPHEHEIAAGVGAELHDYRRARGKLPPFAPLAPCEVRALFAKRSKPVAAAKVGGTKEARQAASTPRLVVDSLSPDVDGGRFPAKRTVGDEVEVRANIFADGHEQLAAELRWRAADEKKWRSARMEDLGNDRWRAAFPLERLGRHEYVIEAWLDRYGGYRRDFKKKLDASVAQPVEYQEGRIFIEQARDRSSGDLKTRLQAFLDRLDAADNAGDAAAVLLDAELALLMDEADDRPHSLVTDPRPIDAERLAARFSSWYELFPRSMTDDPKRHGTFDDVIARMPAIRDMGFDTLYFPPIHPIGKTHRKGRNNTLTPGPDDPGSPYAIGSEEGGHDAIHPELGTLEDFRRMVAAAQEHGLEIALDFAIQCSPDHPWLKEHPGWFDWRPDGTIKYAENPPKKYQDIVNVDFWKDEAIPDLWIALRDVVLFWVEQGVKVFRVDNPHTKPFAFWEWMIGDIRAVHPDTIFLSEAFTRPAVMYRLAKIGFSQSYTYFTWRNTKKELTDYLTELSTAEVADFFRPHFFVNTPDINPTFLHTSGRAGFQIRAVLAATLSGLFGVYSGFELCESQPVPGKEEYWESEKYEIKPRDWQAPGNIIEDITRLNRLRKAYPALQTHLNVRFYSASNDNILYYAKPSPGGGEMILVAVNLDPHNAQEADFDVPLWEWDIPDWGSIPVEDLVGGHSFEWHGKTQHLRLTPDRPYAIWRIAPGGSV